MALVQGVELSEIVVEGGESAKSLNRPGMTRLPALVDAGKVKAVIIAKLDRLTRSVKDLCELLERFERKGVALVSVAESLDTGSAAGSILLVTLRESNIVVCVFFRAPVPVLPHGVHDVSGKGIPEHSEIISGLTREKFPTMRVVRAPTSETRTSGLAAGFESCLRFEARDKPWNASRFGPPHFSPFPLMLSPQAADVPNEPESPHAAEVPHWPESPHAAELPQAADVPHAAKDPLRGCTTWEPQTFARLQVVLFQTEPLGSINIAVFNAGL